jgi:hypothetical protein
MFGDPESKRLKVAALILFHPTASHLSQKGVFLHCDTVSMGRGEGWEIGRDQNKTSGNRNEGINGGMNARRRGIQKGL